MWHSCPYLTFYLQWYNFYSQICFSLHLFSLLLLWCFVSAAAAAAKSHQSCPTLCDPIDGSPPGSPVPGILLARTLEWVAISFSIYEYFKSASYCTPHSGHPCSSPSVCYCHASDINKLFLSALLCVALCLYIKNFAPVLQFLPPWNIFAFKWSKNQGS